MSSVFFFFFYLALFLCDSLKPWELNFASDTKKSWEPLFCTDQLVRLKANWIRKFRDAILEHVIKAIFQALF